LITLSKTGIPMGLREAILEDVQTAIDEFLNREISDQANVQNKNKE